MTNPNWATAKYAIAGPFCKWLIGEFPGGHDAVMDTIRYSQRWERRYCEWRRRPDVFIKVTTTLDAFVIYLGLHLSQIPDHVFTDEPMTRGQGRRLGSVEQERVVAFAKEHGRNRAADAFGITPNAVRYHLDRVGDAA